MISKKISFLAIGFNYQEINDIQDNLSTLFSHFSFDFAISVQDSIYRLNFSNYDIILLDLSDSDIDNIIALKEIYRKGDGITTIVTTKATEISRVATAFGLNTHYFVVKDTNFLTRLVQFIKDIVEGNQVTATEKLQLDTQMKSLFPQFLDMVDNQVMVITADYRIKMVNQRVLEKYNCSDTDIINKKCYKFFYNFDSPCFEKNLPCPLKKVTTTGKPAQVIHSFQNGNERFLLTALPLVNEFNTVIETLVTIRREKQVEVNSFDTALLEVLVDGLSEGLFFCNSDDTIVLLNKAAEKLLNIDKKQLLGKSVFSLPLENGLHWLSRSLENAKSNIHLKASINIKLNNNWLILRFVPLYYNQKEYIGGFLYLTSRTRQESRSEFEADLISLSKYFSSKIVAEG